MRNSARQRGSVLVVAMWVIIALTGLVLTLSFSMRTEAKAGANRIAQAQSEAVEHGAEQFLLSVVDAEIATPGTMANISFEARQVGDSYFWVVRPDWDNETAPGQAQITYGLVDEGAKIDLNSATHAILMGLPNMTEDVADCIVDWRSNPTGTPSDQGAKDDYYMSLPDPYHCKGDAYQSLNELLLVKGVTKDILYGYDRNRNGVIDARESQGNDPSMAFNSATESAVGFAPYVTVYGKKATTMPSTPSRGGGDLNTATEQQLQTFFTQQGVSSAQQLANGTIAARQAAPGGRFASALDWYARVSPQPTYDQFNTMYASLSTSSGPGGGGNTGVAKVNINTAPPEVLRAISTTGTSSGATPALEEGDISAIISHRATMTSPTTADLDNLAWVANVITDKKKLQSIAGRIAGRSDIYSADIVAVSGDGRAFRRYRIVIDGTSTPSRIVWREDLTTAGWPLPPEIRDMLKSGEGLDLAVQATGQGGSVK